MNTFLIRRIRGPVFLLCFALTAILAQWHFLSFAQSWPLYLLTAGFLRLAEAVLPVPAYPGVPRRRATVTGAMLQLLVGAVALLLTIGAVPFSSFWRLYAVWWPLLLVLLGVFLLLERIFDRRSSAGYSGTGVPGVRRRNEGGLFGLVFFLVVLGWLSHFSNRAPWGDWNGEGWRWGPGFNWSFGGETYENDVSLTQPLPADAALTVDNAHGDLQIAPSTDGLIHVDAHQTVRGPERSKNRAFAETRPVLTVHGGTASVTVPGRDGAEVKLVLLVPSGVVCTVRNHHGDIAVSGLRRALDVNQDYGDVTLDSLEGPVHLLMDHGDIHAHALGGDLTVDGRAEDMTVSDIKGRTALRGEFFGSTVVNGAGGPVEFHSRRTDLLAGRMTGELSLDGDDLRLAGVSGGLKIQTRSKNIEVTGLSGDGEIADSNGDLSVTAAAPLGTLTLSNNTGNITLAVPSAASFSVEASTSKNDSLDSEFALAQATEGDSRTLRGQVGQGGPHLQLRTDHGELKLRRATDGESSDGPGERHLRSTGEPPAPAVQ